MPARWHKVVIAVDHPARPEASRFYLLRARTRTAAGLTAPERLLPLDEVEAEVFWLLVSESAMVLARSYQSADL